MTAIEVMQIGSLVKIGDKINAKIIAVVIRNNGYVKYECGWWDGKSHKSEWLECTEVCLVTDAEPLRIGFNSTNR